MKSLSFLLLLVCIACLPGCSETQKEDEHQGIMYAADHFRNYGMIQLSPCTFDPRDKSDPNWFNRYVVELGKDGGTATAKAYYLAEDQFRLNDFYVEVWGDMAGKDRSLTPPEGCSYTVERVKIDKFSSSYTVTAGRNETGKEITYNVMIFDNTPVDKIGQHYFCVAGIIVHQACE